MGSEVLGLIAPHPPIMVEEVGHQRSKVTDASSEAMKELAGILEHFDPDTVIIMSPHSPGISDGFVVDSAAQMEGSLDQFGAPGVRLAFRGDPELAIEILGRLDDDSIPAVDRAAVPALASGKLDHGVLVPMYYLDPNGHWPIVNLSLSYLPYEMHTGLGRVVAEAAAALGRRIAFVASGDCSHRLTKDAPSGFSPKGKELDETIRDLIAEADFAGLSKIDPIVVEEGGECGLRSFITLGGAVGDASTRILSYEGPWGVGYLTAVVNEPTPSSGVKGGYAGYAEHEIVRLARRTIESFVKDGKHPEPDPLSSPELPSKAGCFVTLHRENDLRGCIGTIAPTEDTLAAEVVRNAIQASTADPRFPPVSPAELGELEIKVDVLHVPEPCRPDDLDPQKYGVIVTAGHRRGLLLPDLEGVDTPEDQIAIAMRKAGIPGHEHVELQRFKVDRYA